MTVLVVDDELKIRELVASYLEREGYSVLLSDSGEHALKVAAKGHPDLVVLDLMLPDMSGEEVARSLRQVGNVPIVMLTAKASEEDRVAGLRLGADDYLAKPFSPRELVARVQAVLRRTNGGAGVKLSFAAGSLTIDLETREVVTDGEAVDLTRTEFELLTGLAARPGRVYSRYELVVRAQSYDFEGYERTIDSHVKNLRRKLNDDPKRPRFVGTVPGIGYRLLAKPDA